MYQHYFSPILFGLVLQSLLSSDSLKLTMMEELYCIQEFQEAVDQLNFDTGNERFSNFSQVLRGAAEHNWDLVISNVQNCTPAIFIAALEQWKSEMILPTA